MPILGPFASLNGSIYGYMCPGQKSITKSINLPLYLECLVERGVGDMLETTVKKGPFFSGFRPVLGYRKCPLYFFSTFIHNLQPHTFVNCFLV